MENAGASGVDGCCRLEGVNAASCCFTADEGNLFIFNKMVETSHGIAAAAHTGDHGVGKPAFLFQHLRFDLAGDHGLKIAHDGRKWMRPHDGTEAVMGVVNAACPFPHGLGDSILERGGSGLYRDDLRAEQFHPVNVQSLTSGIFFTHKDDTFHAEKRGGGGGCHTVLSGARLSDEPCFSHLFGEQSLP